MATQKPRYSITVDDELFKQIEDFRFENRYQSRSEATTELIRLGLKALSQADESRGGSAEISKPVKRT